MTQTSNRLLDEVAKLMTDAAGAAQGLRQEAEGLMRAQAERILASMDVVKRALTDLAHVGHADSEPRFAGRRIDVIMSPLPTAKRKLKFNEPDFHGSTAEASQDEADDEG